MSMTAAPHEPVLREVPMHLLRPAEPGVGVVVRNDRCTAGPKAAGFVRHLEIDVSGTPLERQCFPGQSIGVIPEGVDDKGRPHKVRLYSLCSPASGEDGQGKVYATTVKRTIDEHWETHRLFLGVASNLLCDSQVGDRLRVSGPNGKRFVLPQDLHAHDYTFFATGTGIAPFRGMLMELFAAGFKGRVTLIMGSPYATDLLYHDTLTTMQREQPGFAYLTAISREPGGPHGRQYVQDRLRTDRDRLLPQLTSERNLIYICGLAGMELGIFKELALLLPPDSLEQYIKADAEALAHIDSWERRMIHKEVRPTRRVMMEVYA
ncbi:MAG TPA: hypothetical protein DEB06_07045 [Phycisphaerales bacterium]|nr:hypothetical protein [Phycisphaerales bacterium]